MDVTYDTGEILRSSEMEIQQNRSVSWHNLELFKLGTTLFLEWLNETEAPLNTASSQTTDETEHYDSWPRVEMVARLQIPLITFSDFLEQARY